MNTKFIVLMTLLIVATCDTTVNKADACSACSQFKSQSDCVTFGCAWTAATTTAPGSCAKATVAEIIAYCPGLADQTKCWSTYGCAFVDGKCTTFAGCSAYVKTTTADCQAISYQCITNGTTCTDALTCDKYTATQCPSTPDLNGRGCKVDETSGNCRNYNCSEAGETKTTNELCHAFSAGCLTTGAGCASNPLPQCSSLAGTETTCLQMKGSDGRCKFGSGTSCAYKPCTDAPSNLVTDSDCKAFQDNCVTTGKGCIDKLGACSSYASTECAGLIGTDNYCEQDGANTCKAKKCENATFTTNDACAQYQVGCISNGKQCVTTLGNCATYTGTPSECQKIVGKDGNCTGSSTTATVSGACKPKECTEATSSYKTDAQCQAIQSYCKTTGTGCISSSSIASCSTYTATRDDGSDCADLYGKEGKCMYSGSAKKCKAKVCKDAPVTNTTNQACNSYQTDCVTNGAGCQDQTQCIATVKQATCQGTKENSAYCNWNAICVNNISCSNLPTAAICAANKAKDGTQCIWNTSSNKCRNSVCKDYTATTDSGCVALMTGCVTNGTICADPSDCTQFQGIKATCEGYNAKCTQLSTVTTATTACIARSCTNASNDYTTDSECSNYLGTCLTDGSGCIEASKDCTFYTGTATTCPNFTGYVNATSRVQCWSASTSDAPCVQRSCSDATSMGSDADCESFKTGCLYNGKGGCVSRSAVCSSYGYTTDDTVCQNFLGNGTTKCWKGTGGTCQDRACGDYTGSNPSTSECDTFLTDCITDGTKCVPKSTACTSFPGTTEEVCSALTGNGKQCTKMTTCKSVACADKTNATNNGDCTTYHSKCRLVQGTQICQDAKPLCTYYTFSSGATDAHKQAYCGAISTSSGVKCAYDTATTANCVARTSCSQWSSDIGVSVTCADYTGTSKCIAQTNVCYTKGACTTYNIPSTVSSGGESTWCGNMQNIEGTTCTFTSGTICSTPAASGSSGTPTTCEGIPAASSLTSASCNTTLNGVDCQMFNDGSNKKCYTTKSGCASYSTTGIATGQESAYCEALKADNAGVVTQCKYVSGSTCAQKTCADVISGATSQSYCDQFSSGCKYYGGGCYTISACASYTIPTAANSNDLKRLFCQNMYKTGTTTFCSFTDGQTTCADPITDCSTLAGANVAACMKFRMGTGAACHWTADTNCDAPASDVCAPVTSISSASCDLYTTVGLCKNSSGSCVVYDACTAQDYTTGTNADTKSSDCQAFKDVTGVYCSWKTAGTGNACAIAPNTCADWNSLTTTTDNTAFCKARIDKTGAKCSYTTGAAACRTGLLCEFASGPGCQADCDILSTGCIYYNSTCYAKQTNCNLYFATGANNAAKQTYCNTLKNSSGISCTFIHEGTTCVNTAACSSYSVTGASDKTAACSDVDTTDANGCTYWNSGTTCTAIGACSTYTVTPAANIATACAAQVDANGLKCYGTSSSSACSLTPTCEDITGATSLTNCNAYLTGCIYNSNKCYTAAQNCAFTVAGSGSIALCGGFTNTANSDKCTASSDSATTCQPRTCSDSNIPSATTNLGCSTYKSSCKSNGTSCIDGNLACSSYSATTCTDALDADNASKCVAYSNTCIAKDCTLNVTAKTDGECIAFRQGCVTNGAGCVESTVPCSQYQGNQADCSNFTGNNKKCWGNSLTLVDYCRDRTCKDNTTATKDAECQEFLADCVTTGAGCVSKTSPCSAYKGTQATCEGFTEPAGKCWNTSTAAATATCLSRECTLFAGTTDPACAAFMPSTTSTPKCVTNGKACVPSSTKCSGFKGTYLTCPNFTAQDGPCKAASISNTEAACVQRVCTDAPNNYTTDLQCFAYHQNCVTTGRGCIASTSCDSIQTQTACGARGCLWANHCRAAPADCNSLSTYGQSICTNTLLNDGTTKCAWSASTNTCRKFLCVDYDATFTTHKSCHDLDPLCTTSGAGCVNYSSCGSYTSQSVCNAASTTEDSKRCQWDLITAKCRQRICTDFEGTTNEDCDAFLAGCKTTGKACVGPTFNCSEFQLQKLCLQDGNKLPCLWVNGACYNYANCTHATTTLTLEGCKAFNPLCVPSETTCIAQSSCDLYKSSTECKIGIGATTCGWLPSGKCQVFGACSDATGGSTDSACQLYGSTCMTDGTNCVAKGNCSTYLTQTACESTNWGTDGQCKWVASGTSGSCRLAVCTDKTATTDSDCVAFKVASGKCTTDGTTCVARAACTTYNSEAACQVGSDGIPCTYNYPVGTTTGTKSCRAKECVDIKGTSNDQCIGQIAGKNCVSNGKNCVKQDACASYTNKLSCNGGGTDGVCAFSAAPTTADPLAGTCTQFSSCDKANKDQSACSTKSAACQWTSTTTGTTTTTSCTAKNCVQAASGTTCNYIPSFDGTKYTICNLVNNVCTASDPSTLAQSTCYSKSAYTYTWNESTSKCVSCTGSTSTTNNSTSGNTTNQTNTTTDTNGYILGVTIPIVILGFFA